MNYNHPKVQKTATFVRIVCGFLFCIFSFLYLWKVQGHVMGMAQHVLSGGLTVYSPFIGAGIITFLLLLLQFFLNRFLHLDREWHTVSYVPSFFTLSMLTSINATAYTEFGLRYWVWLYPLLWILFLLLVSFIKHIPSTYDGRSSGLALRLLVPNLLTFILISAGSLCLSNTDETLHNQLKIEYKVCQGDLDGALQVGRLSTAVNKETTAVRAYALACRNELGEHLFAYPQKYGADGLLLDLQDSVRMLFPPIELYRKLGAYPRYHNEPAIEFLELLNLSEKAHQPMATDYLLCAYLLNRDLEAFVRTLCQFYDLNNPDLELPRYYAEAMVMYQRKNPGVFRYRNEIQETNYEDYRKLVLSVNNSVVALNKTKRDFGTTYWWYYDSRVRK